MATRRRWLGVGCAHCLWLAGSLGGGFGATSSARAQTAAMPPGTMAPTAPPTSSGGTAGFTMPPRFVRPDVASDEGGLWALMDREETRVRRSPFRIRDEALQGYLSAIVARLAGEHAPDLRVYALRNPLFNASMAPNGMMQVWSGLLLRVDNEAQLAAVIAHEIGHYVQRHTLERLRDVKSRSAFGQFMGLFGIVGLVGQLAMIAGMFGFSREQENEADRIGLELMQSAGYDGREAGRLWEQLIAELATSPDTDPAKNSPLFATHPAAPERSKVLAERARAGGELGAERWAERIGPWRAELLGDELRRGRYDETMVLLERLLAREPGSALLLHYRGETRRLRARDGDTDAARADFESAVQAGGEPALTHRSLGHLLRAQGQTEAARAAFERYLQREPQAPDAELIKQLLTEMSPR